MTPARQTRGIPSEPKVFDVITSAVYSNKPRRMKKNGIMHD
ncbi:hypothetical protein OAV88_03760 [bacterium]|nr:hypothetical protein [bacterium]